MTPKTNPPPAKKKQERQGRWVVSADRIRIEHNLVDGNEIVDEQTSMKPIKAYK